MTVRAVGCPVAVGALLLALVLALALLPLLLILNFLGCSQKADVARISPDNPSAFELNVDELRGEVVDVAKFTSGVAVAHNDSVSYPERRSGVSLRAVVRIWDWSGLFPGSVALSGSCWSWPFWSSPCRGWLRCWDRGRRANRWMCLFRCWRRARSLCFSCCCSASSLEFQS